MHPGRPGGSISARGRGSGGSPRVPKLPLLAPVESKTTNNRGQMGQKGTKMVKRLPGVGGVRGGLPRAQVGGPFAGPQARISGPRGRGTPLARGGGPRGSGQLVVAGAPTPLSTGSRRAPGPTYPACQGGRATSRPPLDTDSRGPLPRASSRQGPRPRALPLTPGTILAGKGPRVP